MADIATEPVTYSRKPKESINRKIFNILKVPLNIPQALRTILDLAAEAFVAKSFKTSAKYFKNALDNMTDMDEKGHTETIILTKYMLCMCWLESTDAKDLLDALKILEELEKNYGYAYPMLYYAVGKAYFKLYRFNKADEVLKKGFAILNREIEVNEYKIPGTDVIIHESSKDRLVAALVTLNDQCSIWHRPDAVCCMPDCASHSQNESADKNIFFGSPTFNGMVQVSCNNTSSICTVSFHMACWKAKKESLCSLGKLSDKDLLHRECFTPNCEDQSVRCTIKKIEIYDENAKIKATIEPRADEVVKHAKVQPPPPKGAIRKQQQPKAKVTTSEPRAPIERHPRPPNVPHEVNKIDEVEEDDDVHDEQALKAGIEELKELRAKNFGIKDEKNWRPNLSMYGNEFMLETGDVLPDPDFSDEGQETAELKAFFFSYFYTFISKSGPVKIDTLAEKWNEAKLMIDDCESILKHYLDITEFLLQSIKFAVVGDYICVAEKLPEAYELVKTNACETLRFFMENDIDQRSNSSSVDDEGFFNDILNQEKNNNSLPYSSISGDSKVDTGDSKVDTGDSKVDTEDSKVDTENTNFVTDEIGDKKKKINEPSVEAAKASTVGQPRQHATPIRKQKTLSEFGIPTQVNDNTTRSVSSPIKSLTTDESAEKKKPAVSSQLPEFSSVAKVVTLLKKIAEKRPHSLEYANDESYNCNEKKMPNATKDNDKRDRSLPRAANGFHHVYEIETQINCPSKSRIVADKFTKESKSVSDIDAYKASSNKDHGAMVSNSGEPAERPNETPLPSPIGENSVTNSERSSNSRASSAAKNEEILVGELLEEVQRLSSKLAISEGRNAQMEAEVAQHEKRHAAEKVGLLKKILQCQYAYNHSLILRKLEECRKNYEILSNIQAILMNSIGSILPMNGAEYQQVMIEIEKISKKHQAKYWELRDKLEATTESENITEVDIESDPLPNLPAMELSDVIQSAFGMWKMHQLKEFQRLQFMPNPMARNHPMYGGPQFRPNYNHNNTGTVLHPQFIPNIPPPQNVHIPPPLFTTLPKKIDHLVPPRPMPAAVPQNPQNSSQQQIPSLFQPPNAFPIAVTSAPSPAQQTFFLPVSQTLSSPVPAAYSKLNNPLQHRHRRNSAEPSFNDNQLIDVRAIEKSALIARKYDSSNDRSSVSSNRPSPVPSTNSDNSKDHFDMRIVENVTSHDTYAKPKTIVAPGNNDSSSGRTQETETRKKNYRSVDRLMQALRSRYVGVLEFDLLKSVEAVRKNHNNSLSGIPIQQIIREAKKYIMDRQQKQLCGYERRPTPLFAAPNSSTWNLYDGERKRETSMSSNASAKKEPHGLFASKKKWEPVVIPNDTWHKETPESECAICFGTMINTESYTLQCKHTFHKACIKHWYTLNQSCPTCRVHSTIDDEYPPLPLG